MISVGWASVDRRATDQSKRGEAYAAALRQLGQMNLIYPCYCSRDQLHAASAPHASDGRVIMPEPAGI